MRRPVCALFAGALTAQLMAAIEPQVTLGPLAAFFVAGAGAAWFLTGRQKLMLWLLAGAVLGLAFAARTRIRLDQLNSRYDGQRVWLTASVEQAQAGESGNQIQARLRVTEANGRKESFCCWCSNLPPCRAGDEIVGWFDLERPGPDQRLRRYADGDLLLASCQYGFEVRGYAGGFRAWTARLQQTLSEALCRDLPDEEAGALTAMVTGDRSRISSQLNSAYRAAGLSHVLVVSGMHVSILCGMGLPGLWNPVRWLTAGQKLAAQLPGALGVALYRRLGLGLVRLRLRRVRPLKGCFNRSKVWCRRLLALWPVVLAVLLSGITGCTPSVLRAAAAVAIGAAGVWVTAPADALTSLAWAGLGMSALNSYAVCDVGFQLSFAAVAGTLAGSALSRSRASEQEEEEPESLLRQMGAKLARNLWTALCISLCATAATFPVLVAWGMSTSPYGLVSGVVILWVVQPLMTLGILAALTGMIPALTPVYRLLAAGAGALVRLLNGWAEMAAGWPGSQFRFETRYAAAVSLALMALCWLAWQKKIRPQFWVPSVVLVTVLAVGSAAWLGRDLIRVGLVGGAQAPSVILAQEETAVVLYRGGSSGREAVESWMEQHGVHRIQLLVDLRSSPSGADRPQAERVITPAWLRPYSRSESSCGPFQVELLTTDGGVVLRVTAGDWQLGTVCGDARLADPAEVDWLLASADQPQAFRWEGVVALGRYSWMEPDAKTASGLLLRPDGGYRMLE